MDSEDRSGSCENDPTETDERDPIEATGSPSDGTEGGDTEPTVDDTESTVDDTESTVDDTEPTVDDTEPTVDDTEPTDSAGSSEDNDESPDRTDGESPDRTDGESPDRTDGEGPPNGIVSGELDEGFEDESEGSETGDDDGAATDDRSATATEDHGATAIEDHGATATEDDARPAGSIAPEDGDVETGVGDIEDTVGDEGNEDERGLLRRFRHDMDGPLMWIREMLSSVAIVLLIGLVLFGVSGVWPPMVAVESGSMEPNMEVGDLVFVTDPGRFAPDAADNDIGVVTYETGQEADYRTFNDYGSVVIFQPPGRQASPIIHRAMFHVEEGENWYDRADERYHGATDCEELRHCPAPRDGFITLGDDNREYDQANGLAEPVAEEWVTGVARLRVPYLGYVRLITTGQAEISDLLGMTTPTTNPETGTV